MKMQQLKITTHSGNEYEVTVESFDPVQTNTDLNNNEIYTVVFGDVILSRIDVKAVVPIKIESDTETEAV
jgi:hypothetical protein